MHCKAHLFQSERSLLWMVRRYCCKDKALSKGEVDPAESKQSLDRWFGDCFIMDKPENPGTEDSADSKVNKANSGTHIYTYDALNRMVSSQIAKELTNYTYDSLGNLVLETVKNKSVDYEYNELNQLVRKTTSTNDTYTYSYDKRGNCAGAERRLRRMQRGGGGAKKGAGKPPSARRRTRLFLASGLPRPAKRRPSPSCTTPLTAWWKARTGRAIPRPTPTTVWACG